MQESMRKIMILRELEDHIGGEGTEPVFEEEGGV